MVLQQQKSTNNEKSWYAVRLGMELGFLIALPLVLSILAGIFLDRALKTFPFILICSVFFGIILTFVNVYKVILPFLEKRSLNNKK